jgi:hypothetical protein
VAVEAVGAGAASPPAQAAPAAPAAEPEGEREADVRVGGAEAQALGPLSDFFPPGLSGLAEAAQQYLDNLQDLGSDGARLYLIALAVAGAAITAEVSRRWRLPAAEVGLPGDWAGPAPV